MIKLIVYSSNILKHGEKDKKNFISHFQALKSILEGFSDGISGKEYSYILQTFLRLYIHL